MHRTAIVGTKLVILLLLAASLFVQVVLIPIQANQTVAMFPEVEYLRVPGIVTAVAITACGQLVLLCTWRLLTMVATSSIFGHSAFGFVNVMIGSGAAAAAIGAFAFIALNLVNVTPPGVMIFLLGGCLTCLGLTLLLIVMKGLLRKATQLEHDLSEVV